MLTRLFAVAAAVLLAPVCATAADPPPIVFQAQPLERTLGDLRAAANLIGGEKGIKAVNAGIKEHFGEKGLDGVDVGRPIVGYVVLAPKPEDITAVLALPITGEKEFLELCERANKQKPMPDAKDKGLYELPPLTPNRGYRALLRFSEQYAYIAYGVNPTPHIDAKSLVPMPKLYDPADPGLISARFYFDRIPLPVKLALPTLLGEVKKKVLDVLGLGNPHDEWLVKAVGPEIEKLFARYARLAAGADVLTVRLGLDVPTANLAVEAVLTPKTNSELAGIIAAWKPTGNKFAGLMNHPDTVAGFKVRLPLFEEEIRAATAAGFEAGAKEIVKNVPPDAPKAALEELLKGFARTAKTGQFDIAGAFRGPDKDGWFTAVGALAFDDTAALEKEFKAYIQKTAPQDELDRLKWDVAKVGKVGIHRWKLKPGRGGFFFPDFPTAFGGDDCSIAFAFAPSGIFVAVGPDAVGTLKDTLAVKPADSPVIEVVLNPAKVGKLVQKMEPNDPQALLEIQKLFGSDDKLLPALTATLEGGKELKAKLAINLRIMPRAILVGEIERVGGDEAGPVPVKK
jgi:hypothetical protein